MENKYITKLLTFSDENLMGNYKIITLDRKAAKGILKEIHRDYIPISLIEKKIEELEKFTDGYNEEGEPEPNLFVIEKIELLQELLDERSRDGRSLY